MTAIVVGWSSKVKAIVVGWPSIIRAIVVDLPKKCYSGEGSSNLMNIGGEGVPQAQDWRGGGSTSARKKEEEEKKQDNTFCFYYRVTYC